MKTTVEIDLPDGFVSEADSVEVLRDRLQGLFDTADQPIKLKTIREIEHDPVWQVWKENADGDWVVLEAVGNAEFPTDRIRDEGDYQSLKDRTCRTAKGAEFLADKRILERGEKPVIRHENDIAQDPITIHVYTPDHGETLLDISSFLLEAREIDLETIALSRWEIGFLHVGTALEGLEQKAHPAFRTALDGKKLNEAVDGKAPIFMHELLHNRDEFEAYLLETRGHEIAAFVDSEKLEAWLRQNRSDVNYPDSTPTP